MGSANCKSFKSFCQKMTVFARTTFKSQRAFLNLTLPVLCMSESCIQIKINFNFNFHTSLWCLKRFYDEGLKSLLFHYISVYWSYQVIMRLLKTTCHQRMIDILGNLTEVDILQVLCQIRGTIIH